MKRIVILGNGIAGITAARHLRKRSDDEILVISGETDHFFSRTALMYIYMGHMKYEHTKPYEDFFWAKNRIGLRRAWVERVDVGARQLVLQGGDTESYDTLVLATGSKSNMFGWPGQDLDGVQGLYSFQDLESMEAASPGLERAVVIGGGLIGVEMAEMFHTRNIPVTFLVREKSWMQHAYPPEESELINCEIRANGIDLRLGTELEEIEGEGGRAVAVRTKDGERIPCGFVGLTVGVSPNIGLIEDSGIETERGILVNEFLETSVPGIYAIGDCAQVRDPKPGRRPVEPLWYSGRKMGETLGLTLSGTPTAYDPGLWFNSAKFFDLEWQVYGQVPSKPDEGSASLYWQQTAGDGASARAIRIQYRPEGDGSDGPVEGFQLLGIRYRQEVCHEWLREGRRLRWVLQNLGVANFDPELHRQHEADIVATYNQAHPGRPLELQRKRGLSRLFELRRAS